MYFLKFCVRRSIDALDPENQPGFGSRAYRGRLTPKVQKQKRRLPRLSRIFVQKYLKYLLLFRVKSPGIRNLIKTESATLLYLPMNKKKIEKLIIAFLLMHGRAVVASRCSSVNQIIKNIELVYRPVILRTWPPPSMTDPSTSRGFTAADIVNLTPARLFNESNRAPRISAEANHKRTHSRQRVHLVKRT